MNKLIIGITTYNWVRCCSGVVFSDKDKYDLLILTKDTYRSIIRCDNLCHNAVFEQRLHDLTRLSNSLKLRKMNNLCLCNIKNNTEKLTVQLALYIKLSGVDAIFCEYHSLLKTIFTRFIEQNIIKSNQLCYFGNVKPNLKFTITDEVFNKKKELKNLMIGANNKLELNTFNKVEYFWSE